MKKRLIISVFVLIIFLLGFILLEQSKEGSLKSEEVNYNCPDCNVILISIDSLREDHVGVYGYEKNTTPNIDEFSKDSVVFENAYSGAPHTIPSLSILMTGKGSSNEKKESIEKFWNETPHIAEILESEGYSTAWFTGHPGLTKDYHSLQKGFETFEGSFRIDQESVPPNSNNLSKKAINWLEKNSDEKFFLWVHYFDPHMAYYPLPEYESKFGYSKEECGRIYPGIDINNIVRNFSDGPTKKEVDCLISLYDSEIFYTDESIGLLLDKVNELNLTNNTLIILTADHGEEFMERTRIGHGETVYNELIHVPFIIRNPYQDMPERIEKRISTLNIFEIITGTVSNKIVSLSTEIVSKKYPWYLKGSDIYSPKYSLIIDPYKYIFTTKGGLEEFYNLEKDPLEKNNLINSIDPSIKKELQNSLQKWKERNNFIDNTNYSLVVLSKKEIKEKEEKLLKSQGYLI